MNIRGVEDAWFLVFGIFLFLESNYIRRDLSLPGLKLLFGSFLVLFGLTLIGLFMAFPIFSGLLK